MDLTKEASDKNLLLISIDDWESRAVLVEKKRVVEFYAERRNSGIPVNSVLLGVIKDIKHSLNCAFINVGFEKNAFMNCEFDKIEREDYGYQIPKIEKGREILVQLVKPAHKTKGARVDFRISIPGRYLVYLPLVKKKSIHISRKVHPEAALDLKQKLEQILDDRCGIIIRTAAINAPFEIIKKEYEVLRERWELIKRIVAKKSAPCVVFTDESFPVRVLREVYSSEQDLIVVDNESAYNDMIRYAEEFVPDAAPKIVLYKEEKPLFEKISIESKLRKMFDRVISLQSGGYIVIDRREALTVIDVNSGKFTDDVDHESMAYRTNMDALPEIINQIRLRNINGIILVDFIDIKDSEKKQALFDYASLILESDRAAAAVEFIPSMTAVIFTRKSMANVSYSFYEEECARCHGSGWVPSVEAVSVMVLRKIRKYLMKMKEEAAVISVNEKVCEYFKREMKSDLNGLMASFKKKIYLNASPLLENDELEVNLVGPDELVKKHFGIK